MPRAPLHHATVRTLCQATEVPEKVEAALAVVAGPAPVTRAPLEGQWGQPILAMEAHLSGRMAAARLQHILAAPAVGERLAAELPRRLDDDCVLHARFDKQRAAEGVLTLTQGDDSIVLRAKIAAFPARREVALTVLASLASATPHGAVHEEE